MVLRRTTATMATAFETAVDFLPEKYKLDHGSDQYGVERHFVPPTGLGPLQLTPPSEEELYSPIKEPFLVPPKYRKNYNFLTGHGKYLYSKDPLWVEARERHWDDLQMSLQVHRKNYEHLRKIYRKQWQDADRYNLDEYLTVMSRVKLEEKAEREVSEENSEKLFQEDLAKIDAINELKEKRRKMILDRKWKLNIWKYERYSEDLQYLTNHKVQDFITYDNMDTLIEEQVTRWSQSSETNKLNMFGRIPYQEVDCRPELEVQYLFMKEDLSEDGREAFSRLNAVSESSSTMGGTISRDSTYADFNFDDDDDVNIGESGLEPTTGDVITGSQEHAAKNAKGDLDDEE
eukprot:TRINITY_DN874_c1_g1_i1.p1 TRINITY_DN874_c1_g1~~TRINITY_DN874_c1_g1_i1.p1  ORF type:complete len:359 (+),score=74.40 TRINITY_DN874_c1_g1_i1:42-1079(+)